MYAPVASGHVSCWLGHETGSRPAVRQGTAVGSRALVLSHVTSHPPAASPRQRAPQGGHRGQAPFPSTFPSLCCGMLANGPLAKAWDKASSSSRGGETNSITCREICPVLRGGCEHRERTALWPFSSSSTKSEHGIASVPCLEAAGSVGKYFVKARK